MKITKITVDECSGKNREYSLTLENGKTLVGFGHFHYIDLKVVKNKFIADYNNVSQI